MSEIVSRNEFLNSRRLSNNYDSYEDYVLVGFSGLKVGQKIKVPGTEITNSVKRFWKQSLFSSVKISHPYVTIETFIIFKNLQYLQFTNLLKNKSITNIIYDPTIFIKTKK